MLTFLELGNYGRFGNQLFQISATLGAAIRNHHTCIFPTWKHAGLFEHSLPQTEQRLRPDLVLHEVGYAYGEIEVPPDNRTLISLHGYFQSERFFIHCRDLVRDCFLPVKEILQCLHSKYGRWLSQGPTCAVYVRRGDYALYPDHHPMQSREYYLNAMAQFEPETIFFVSSDDMPWCEQHLDNERCIFLRDESFAHCFFLGTLCDAVIISNSSFGWWAAWLNGRKRKVIAPRVWFGPAYGCHDTRDLIPSDWIVL